MTTPLRQSFATGYYRHKAAPHQKRMAYDFICMAIAEENLNVKIVCGLPGLITGYGPSHQATDDLAIFRAMPNLMIVDPCDALEIEQAVPAIAENQGPVYMQPAAWQRAAAAGRVRLYVRDRQGQDATIKPLDEHTILSEARNPGVWW